jgi:hypothetical protein
MNSVDSTQSVLDHDTKSPQRELTGHPLRTWASSVRAAARRLHCRLQVYTGNKAMRLREHYFAISQEQSTIYYSVRNQARNAFVNLPLMDRDRIPLQVSAHTHVRLFCSRKCQPI